MHKVDGFGHDDNQFTEGDASTGTPPARVTADWLNAVQGELVAVIEAVGLALSKPDNTQLLQALRLLTASRTGDASPVLSSPPAGWVNANGGSIGNAASGATERANADCSALFTVVWNNLANADAPVQDSAGTPVARGASAAADFAANRRIVLNKPFTTTFKVIVKL